MRHTPVIIFIFTAILFFVTGCGKEAPPVDTSDGRFVQLAVVEFETHSVLPSSVLRFRLRGTDRVLAFLAEVEFLGRDGTNREIARTFQVIETTGLPRTNGDVGDIVVELPVDEGLWELVGPTPNARYFGNIEIRVIDELGVSAEGRLDSLELTFQSEITPEVATVPNGDYFVNQGIDVSGQNFLMPSEGTTWAVANGTMTYEMSPPRVIEGQRIAIEWNGSRTRARFPIDPGTFGVEPGTFEGSLAFENQLRTGQTAQGNQQESFVFEIQQSFIASLTPEAGSRGQKITINGRGLIPNRAGDEGNFGMILRFDGTFAFDAGGDVPIELERSPDRVLSEQVAEQSVWYEIVDNRLTGFGANPGLFTGTITPILFETDSEQIGVSWEGEFRILTDKQMVHIKYLPAFSRGLEKYGLQNVEFEVRQKILEIANRDYGQVNVVFVEEAPTDFLEYATIEVGGPDPTGGQSFGIDNTCNVAAQRCKDTDNLYLGDYLGGINATSDDQFNTPYGGVFIESFDYFSRRLNPNVPDSSEDFDQIFGPFMPALDGTPVRGTEWPGGERSAEIAEAIRVFGTVIGNTLGHEIGHSLGLAFYPQDRTRPSSTFHNLNPCEYCIMNAGSSRPFRERAELEGREPFFAERNMDYLLEILPRTD